MKKRILGVVICLIMCLSLCCVPALAAGAGVDYVEYSWNDGTGLSSETKTVTEYTEVTAETKEWNNGWYVVTGDVTINARVTVKGHAKLILTDGCSLSTNGITVNSSATLTIYGQDEGTGQLSAVATDNYAAGIGGKSAGYDGGTVVIHGGVVWAESKSDTTGAGIGGGGAGWGSSSAGDGGTVTIYSGTVTAIGKYENANSQYDGGAGIGGGGGNSYKGRSSGKGGRVEIYGGVVTATGGSRDGTRYGAGIGGGGGTEGSKGGAGGTVTVAGGIVTATGYTGIGCGANGKANGNGTLTANNCIINGKVYGSFTLTEDYTVNNFTIPEGATLTVPSGVTLTVNGKLQNDGTIENNGTLLLQEKSKITGSGTVTGSGSNRILNITADQIQVPTDLVYSGNDLTESARSRISVPSSETICGKEFVYDNWTLDSIFPGVVKDAGTYTVTYKKDGNSLTQIFAVAPKPIVDEYVSVSGFDAMTYTGESQTPQAAVTIDGLTVTGTWSNVENVTDKTVFTADGNFTGSTGEYSTGMLPKSVTAVATAEDKYWDGTDAAEVSVTVDTGIAGETIEITGVTAAFEDAGIGDNKTVNLNKTSMVITYPNDKPENYIVIVPDTITADISVIPLTISGVKMNAESYTYGDTVGYDSTALSIYQPGGTTAKAEDLVYTYAGTANDGSSWNSAEAPTKAGSYTLTVSHSDTAHYSGVQEISFTIQRKLVEVPVQAEPVTYNGQAQTYAVIETEYYTVSGGLQTNANEVGYAVTISLKDSDNTCWAGESIEDLTHSFVIGKAPVTITAKNQSYHVGTRLPDISAPELGRHYTVDGLFGEDSIGTVTMKYQKAGEDVTPSINNVGTYDIVMLVDNVNPNYELSLVNGKLTYYFIPTYTPEVVDTEGGDVTVSSRYPTQMQTVTITPKPDEGMMVDTVTVTDSRGNTVEVTENDNGTYSFKQPAGSVTITVTFKSETCPSEAYSDLDTEEWYHEAVDYVLWKGLMNGVGNGKFDPDGATSRAMIVTILWRLEGEPVYGQGKSGTFADVPEYTWYTEAVEWAAANGIVNGYGDGSFGPNDDITREQLATILYRYEQYKGGGFTGAWMFLLDFTDRTEVSDWAYEAMCWTNMHGIVNGKGEGILDPKGSAKRSEAAQMLMNYLER